MINFIDNVFNFMPINVWQSLFRDCSAILDVQFVSVWFVSYFQKSDSFLSLKLIDLWGGPFYVLVGD